MVAISTTAFHVANDYYCLFLPRPFIRYCMRRVHLLRKYDITPILVFDGGYLPTKANVEQERRE